MEVTIEFHASCKYFKSWIPRAILLGIHAQTTPILTVMVHIDRIRRDAFFYHLENKNTQ